MIRTGRRVKALLVFFSSVVSHHTHQTDAFYLPPSGYRFRRSVDEQNLNHRPRCFRQKSKTLRGNFLDDVIEWLDDNHVQFRPQLLSEVVPMDTPILPKDQNRTLILEFQPSYSNDTAIWLHLLPSPTKACDCLDPFLKPLLSQISAARGDPIKVIHIEEDIWYRKNDIVKQRLYLQVHGPRRRIFARSTVVQKIPQNVGKEFLQLHHLWGATQSRQYIYGLYCKRLQDLVAVASFSKPRAVERSVNNGESYQPFRSTELLRFCTLPDTSVVGGVSKLMKAMTRDYDVDDIVTVIDRDWGDGSQNWHSIGFDTVQVLDPLIMTVDAVGRRRHLVGAGIQHNTTNLDRLGISPETLSKVNTAVDKIDAWNTLVRAGYFPVHDTGVERLFKVSEQHLLSSFNTTQKEIWEHSKTSFAKSYYSPNPGIAKLLHHDKEEIYRALWKLAASNRQQKMLVASFPSSMDPQASIQIHERGYGFRTVSFNNGTHLSSIYHGIYKVNPSTGEVEPRAVVSEHLKTMAAALLTVCPTLERKRILHLGLGAGTLSRFLVDHNAAHERSARSHHTVVELDSAVVRAFQLQSEIPPSMQVIQADAVTYCKQNSRRNEKFDIICIDIFDEFNEVPASFYNATFLRCMVDNCLSPNEGIVIHNLHSGGKRRDAKIQQMIDAYVKVFRPTPSTGASYQLYCIPSLDSQPNGGNTILVAHPHRRDNRYLKERAKQASQTHGWDIYSRLKTAKEVVTSR